MLTGATVRAVSDGLHKLGITKINTIAFSERPILGASANFFDQNR